jgi:hypothetical protein
LADRGREESTRADITKCFMCGVSMLYRGSRFCSEQCCDFYDTGEAGPEQDWRQPRRIVYRDDAGKPMSPTMHGFKILCDGCGKEFESSGLRACSTDCERRHRDRQTNLAVMAEAGIEPAAKRRCAVCAAVIPAWRKGRKVSSATRYCSPKCGRRAKRLDTQNAVFDIETAKEGL